MYLTREEERILDGEEGWGKSVLMEILVKMGELFNADKLIPIESAHLSGVSFKTIGRATQFLEQLAKEEIQVSVPTTLNPAGFNPNQANEILLGNEEKKTQAKILSIYSKFNVDLTLTCTPYYFKDVKYCSHHAWAESSAISYINSVLGAKTNREGATSALASAIIGKTPNCGLHLDKNRYASIKVKVTAKLREPVKFGALGLIVGKNLGDLVPVFTGLKINDKIKLKFLAASLASSGMTSLFHIDTVTPEWVNKKVGWKDGKPLDKLTIDDQEIETVIDATSNATIDECEIAIIGCPHCSPKEIIQIVEKVRNRKIKKDKSVWILCAPKVNDMISNEVRRAIRKTGFKLISGVCPIVGWLPKVKAVATNSGKAAFYLPKMAGIKVCLASLNNIIEEFTEQ